MDSYLDVCQFEVKKVFTYNQFNDLLENFIPNLDYPIKGLIFFPINKKYNNLLYLFPREGNNKNKMDSKGNSKSKSKNDEKDIKKLILKINEKIREDEVDKLVIDFKITDTDTPDIFHLNILNDEKYIFFGLAHIQTLKCSRFIKKIFNMHEGDNKDIIVKCKYSLKFKKWEPIELSDNNQSNTMKYLKGKLNI